MDITILAKCLRANVGDYTFQEAYDRSHRILNIVVSPTSGVNSGAMLMNYLTAPNVVCLVTFMLFDVIRSLACCRLFGLLLWHRVLFLSFMSPSKLWPKILKEKSYLI